MNSLFNFLKRTGIGLLYILGSPVIAFGFILFSVYGTLIFLFILIRSSLLWVLEGEKFFSKFPEDILSESRYQDYLKQNPPAHKSPTPNLGEKQ